MKNTKIMLTDSIMNHKGKEIELYQVLELIKRDEKLKNLVEEIRNEEDKEIRSRLKKRLPIAVFQGTFSYIKREGLTEASQLAVIDLDSFGQIEEIKKIKTEICKNEYVLFCFLSPSGGIKVGCKIPKVYSDEEYKQYYLPLSAEFDKYSGVMKIKNDGQTKDVCRLCFLSYDEDMYINYDAKEYCQRQMITKDKPKCDISDYRTSRRDILDAMGHINPDEREDWITVCCALKFYEDETQDMYFQDFVKWSSKSDKYKGEEDCRKTWDSFSNNGKNNVTLASLFYLAKKNGYKPKIKFQSDFQRFTAEDQAKKIINDNPMFYDNMKQWWGWNKNENCWMMIDEVDIILFIKEAFQMVGLSKGGRRAEMLNALKDEARSRKPLDLKDTQIQIGCKIYDIASDEILDASPKYKPNLYIDHEIFGYLQTENLRCEKLDKIFGEWVNDEKQTLYDITAFMMSPKYFLDVCFWLVGNGENGKSLFQRVIHKVVGKENITSQDLEILSDPKDRFTKAFLRNKLICSLGDGNYQTINHSKAIKTLSGGSDIIRGEIKGGGQIDFYNTAKLIGAFNTLPETNDKTSGFYRRQHITEFKNDFSGLKNPLPEVPDEEYSILCAICFRRLKEMYKNNELNGWGDKDERKRKYERLSDPLNMFIQENMVEDYHGSFFLTKFHKEYREFALKNGFNEFQMKHIEARLHNKGFEKKRKSVYIHNGFCWGRFDDIPQEMVVDETFQKNVEKKQIFEGFFFKSQLKNHNQEKLQENYDEGKKNLTKNEKNDEKLPKSKKSMDRIDSLDIVFNVDSYYNSEATSKSMSKSSKVSIAKIQPSFPMEKNKHKLLLEKVPKVPICCVEFYSKFAEKFMSVEEYDEWCINYTKSGDIYEPKSGYLAKL